jgi:hypothetical protein
MHTCCGEQVIFQCFYLENIKYNLSILLIKQDPQRAFLLEKLNNSSVTQEISRFVCNPKCRYSVTTATFIFALSQIPSVHTAPTYSF